ncbi:MAG: MoaD/ThiS family protein [Candidatus Eremiobacteraeota bacterium]|nr:MoaD/ThiS family protein [Candidatus Eremiobacteraeota bacterium]
MKIKVKILGVLKKPEGKSIFQLELPDGAKLTDIYERLNYTKLEASFVVPAVNGKVKKPSHTLSENDEVLLSMTVGGG